MALQSAILVDERDKRLGRLMVSPACHVIKYGDAFFVRTAKMVRPIPSVTAMATVFEQTEPFTRNKLEPI